MSNVQIVRIHNGWGELSSDTWAVIHHCIARGESFGIWNGYWNQAPDIKTGRCRLKVKVGKRRKLIAGTITLEYEGRGSDDGETYSYRFHPKPRVLTRNLHSRLYEHINDVEVS